MTDRPEIAALMIPAIADTAGGGGGATFGESYDNYQREINAISHRLNTIGVSVDDLVESDLAWLLTDPYQDGHRRHPGQGHGRRRKHAEESGTQVRRCWNCNPVSEAHNREVYDNDHAVP